MNNNNNNNGAAGQDKKDYLDKAVESVEKKFGGSWGQNTTKNRGINEKIVRFLPPTPLAPQKFLHLITPSFYSRVCVSLVDKATPQTDGIRNFFEKSTGKKVPKNVSN
jgi:hypothetical protein